MIEPDLVRHVAESTGLSPTEAARVVDDVVAYFGESVEDYVRRRHRALRTHGMKNPEIWHRVALELSARVVAAPALSERQLRRIVYG